MCENKGTMTQDFRSLFLSSCFRIFKLSYPPPPPLLKVYNILVIFIHDHNGSREAGLDRKETRRGSVGRLRPLVPLLVKNLRGGRIRPLNKSLVLCNCFKFLNIVIFYVIKILKQLCNTSVFSSQI